MLYGTFTQTEDGEYKVTSVLYERPQYYHDDGTPLDDENLFSMGVAPILYPEYPKDFDGRRFKVITNHLNECTVNIRLGAIVDYYAIVPRGVEEIYNNFLQTVNQLRDVLTYKDISYTFPNGIQGTIQLRNEKDLTNIMSIETSILTNLVLGDSVDKSEDIIFLDKEDVEHVLNSGEALKMVKRVKDHVRRIREISWNHKHNILKSIYEDESISDDEKIARILDHDVESLWAE